MKNHKAPLSLLILLTVLILLTACGGIPETPAGEPAEAAIQAAFQTVNDQRLSTLTLDLAQLPAAAEGQTYVVWVIADDGTATQVGTAVGGQAFIWASPAGENLVGKVVGARVSVEDAAAAAAGGLAAPSEDWFGGSIPETIRADIRLLVVSAPDTPANAPYDPSLKDQTLLAYEHAGLAQDAVNAGDLAGAQNHAEHIINILLGSADAGFGDHNGDGQTQNPGDGFGVWPYAFKVAEVADHIAETPGLSNAHNEAALFMGACARTISTTGPQAIEQARLLLDTTEVEAGQLIAQNLVDLLYAMANGTDANGNGTIEAVPGECGAQQIYQLAHRLFDFVLTKSTADQ